MTEATKKKRDTAAERRDREAVARETERLQAQEKALAEWPARLMLNLERATKQGWYVRVVNGRFAVEGRDTYGDMEVSRFGLTPVGRFERWGGEGDWEEMDEMERRLDRAEEAQREAERKAAVRQGALAKLTAEERKELGL